MKEEEKAGKWQEVYIHSFGVDVVVMHFKLGHFLILVAKRDQQQ